MVNICIRKCNCHSFSSAVYVTPQLFTVHQCIVALRRTCQIVEAQCTALGAEGVANYERRLKMKIMPEFALPFLFHLLSHRPETPTIYSTSDVDEEVHGEMKCILKGKPVEQTIH